MSNLHKRYEDMHVNYSGKSELNQIMATSLLEGHSVMVPKCYLKVQRMFHKVN